MSQPMFVVSNAGPLMVLAKLNLLYLLKRLYGRVHIAQSVYDEVVTEGMRQGHEDARTLFLFLNQMQWKPESITASAPNWLPLHLDRGERDTLTLADIAGNPLILMDELNGHQAARTRGLRTKGSLGILIEAYRNGLIDITQLRLYFAEIVRRRDIWIDPALVERLLVEVTETSDRMFKDYHARLVKEELAWYGTDMQERTRYQGQFVAVHDGEVVDCDTDQRALYVRIRERFGQIPILIVPGEQTEPPTYTL